MHHTGALYDSFCPQFQLLELATFYFGHTKNT